MKWTFKQLSLITVTALLGFTGTASAANNTSGWYVGFGAGQESGVLKAKEDIGYLNQNYNYALSGTLLNAHIGYDFFLSQHAVLGLEAFYAGSNTKAVYTDNDSTENQVFKKTHTTGFSALPGVEFGDNRIYARLGWAKSTFTHSYDNTDLYAPSFNVDRNAIQYGVGYQTALSADSRWTLNFDYIHSVYNSIQQTSGTNSFEFKPIFNEYTASLNYYFSSILSDNEAPAPVTNTSITLVNNALYVGASTGVVDTRLTQAYSLPPTNSSTPYALNGALINGHIGYRLLVGGGFTLGAEIFTQANTATMNYDDLTDSTSNYTLKEGSSYGISILPGIEWGRNLTFIRASTISTEFSKTGSNNEGPLFSKRVSGAQIGIADEIAVLTKGLSVTLEYDRTSYKEINTSDETGTYNLKPSESDYKIGLNYAF